MKRKCKFLLLLGSIVMTMLLAGCSGNQEPANVHITPLENLVYTGDKVTFTIQERNVGDNLLYWDFGDSTQSTGKKVSHTYDTPGVYFVQLFSTEEDGMKKQSSLILRVHNTGAQIMPQVILDTDARNEIDDQHYIAYAMYSEIDVLAINSIHNGTDFSEEVNYGEIYYVLRKLWYSDFPGATPLVFRGAPHKLNPPENGKWEDTKPIVTDAGNAILAAARGASPAHPVYVIPVGPCTNIASALIQAKKENFDLDNRIRVIWLGGGPISAGEETYNGSNDPWSVYVVGKSGIDFTIMLEHPTSARLQFKKPEDAKLYPDNQIGHYLRDIVLSRMNLYGNDKKSLYDLTTISTVINNYLGLNWITEIKDMQIGNKEENYIWKPVEGKSNIHVILDIDEEAMKNDFFNTLNENPTNLLKNK